MDPSQAINTLSQVAKSAKLPYNDHVLLERCVDVLAKAIQGSQGDTAESSVTDIPSVTFDETAVVAETATKPKSRARARSRKGGK